MCLLAAVTVTAAPVSGAAQPYHPVPIAVQGKPGVWFERSEAEHLLHQIERVTDLKSALSASTQLNTALRNQVTTSSAATQLALDLATTERERGDHWHQAYQAELDRSGSLLNAPLFWLAIGLVAGGGVAGTTAWLATR